MAPVSSTSRTIEKMSCTYTTANVYISVFDIVTLSLSTCRPAIVLDTHIERKRIVKIMCVLAHYRYCY